MRILDGHTHTVLCIIELESGFLASGSIDQSAIIWDPNNGKIVNILEGFQNPIIGLTEFDQKQIVINFNEPLLLVWEWNTSSKAASNSSTFSLRESNLSSVNKHQDFLLCGCEDGKIYRLEPEKSEKPTLEYDSHSDVILDMKTINETQFISNSTDLSIILWDVNSAEILKKISLVEDICLSMHYDKELDLLMFSSLDGRVRAVDLSPDLDATKPKYIADQKSPIYFSAWVGFKEMKFL